MNAVSVRHFFEDPDISVLEMIEKYEISISDEEAKVEKKKLRCAVCGATASGYNFDQITCESCKAFFRRNALRDINELRCRFSGNCKITTETRRHCPYCRIEKCFSVGMRKEWIRSEEEKRKKCHQLEKKGRRKYFKLPTIPDLLPIQYSRDSIILKSSDRVRLSNITHCYTQFCAEPSLAAFVPITKPLFLRLDEFFNRKKSVYINLISYFKHLPEVQALTLDDQVSLIKQNIRIVMPLNYAIFRTPVNSPTRNVPIKTIGCQDDIDLNAMLRSVSAIFIDFVACDPLIIQIFMVILLFTTSSLTTRSIFDPGHYEKLNTIKEFQSFYTELLWSYLLEKYGEENAVHIFTRMISKYLYVQLVVDQMDSIIHVNNDVDNLDPLMRTMLQLT